MAWHVGPLSRRGFLTKGAQLVGGVVASLTALRRMRSDGLPRRRTREAASTAATDSGPGLAKLRAAYESNDIDQLIALLHPNVEWRGIKPSPWQRAPT
jgi:hypothetical protein